VIEPINEVPDVESEEEQTNIWEKRLEQMIIEDWGFSGFGSQKRIKLPDIGGWTKPDLVHEEAQIAIYLDGPHHDDPDQKQQDRMLRNTLRNKGEGWIVIEVPIQDAENDQMMNMYRQQISRNLES